MDTDRKQMILDYVRQDPFAKQLGAAVDILAPGHSRVALTVTEQMVNFHGMTHGGVIFALGDIAFAAAGNSCGQTAVALNVSINFLKATHAGDRLIAEAKEVHASGPTALYAITITEERTGTLIAQSEDLVYRKKEWFVPQSQNSPDAERANPKPGRE